VKISITSNIIEYYGWILRETTYDPTEIFTIYLDLTETLEYSADIDGNR
jgi:hypothetical protein